MTNWTADEIENDPTLNEPVRAWGRACTQAGIRQLVVSSPVRELFDDGTGKPVVDIWVLQRSYHDSAVRWLRGQRRGMEIWDYTALNQDGFAPKWLLDVAPINYRVIQGFMNQSLGITGVLNWSSDYWYARGPRVVTNLRDVWTEPAAD